MISLGGHDIATLVAQGLALTCMCVCMRVCVLGACWLGGSTANWLEHCPKELRGLL